MDLRSSPWSCQRSAIQVPKEPVTCTSGASGPALPPADILTREARIIEGFLPASSRPPRKWILSTITAISPGFPRKWITRPITKPASGMTISRLRPSNRCSLWVISSKTFQYKAANRPQTVPTAAQPKTNREIISGLRLTPKSWGNVQRWVWSGLLRLFGSTADFLFKIMKRNIPNIYAFYGRCHWLWCIIFTITFSAFGVDVVI